MRDNTAQRAWSVFSIVLDSSVHAARMILNIVTYSSHTTNSCTLCPATEVFVVVDA